MIPLHPDPHFTFRFAADRLIHGFHLEGVKTGRRVSVFKLDPATDERLEPVVPVWRPTPLASRIWMTGPAKELPFRSRRV
jgi:hypothetical protein